MARPASAPVFALILSAASLACAHAQPATTAADAARPAAAQPQLAATASQPSATPARDEKASGQADLDAALARLSGVSVFFLFDQAALTPEAEEKLAEVGDVLREHPALSVRVEGNCDERGTTAYNLALGQRRADAARSYLLRMGAGSGQVVAISYGEERPKATGHDEEAWARNRRDDVVTR